MQLKPHDLMTSAALITAQSAQAAAEGIAEALKVSEMRYRRLFEASRDGILILDSQTGRITDSNPFIAEMLGYSSEELFGRELWEIGLLQDKETSRTAFQRLRQEGFIRYEDLPLETRRGERREVEFVSSLYRENEHTVVQCNIRDITERKAAESARRLLGTAVESAIDGIIVVDAQHPDRPILYANPAFLSLTGYTAAEVVGWNCRFLQGKDTDPAAVRRIRDALRDGHLCRVTLLNYRKDGTTFWNELVISPVQDGAGQVTHFVGIQHDVTVLRQVEDALRESEERFRQMADAMPHIAWTARPDGSIDYYNQRWYDYTGLTFDETQKRGWTPIVHAEDLPVVLDAHHLALEQAKEHEEEFRLKQADGSYRWHLGRTMPIKNVAGEVVKWVGTYTDITESRQAAQMQMALFEREHTIAAHLQAALQPELPKVVPGMALAKYYKSALEASEGVGGDFYDCYTLDQAKTHVALVVGDVSGKGLAAASQVATVRNMLRFALLSSGQTLAESLTVLNRMLAENELLAGFATLFVGVYDSAAHMLTYVNCGQEPGLLRRAATGSVEMLHSTGLILGSIADARFTQKQIRLDPMDCLVLFTDGLTDAGPNHREMLGVKGIEALLEACAPTAGAGAGETAACLVSSLIAGMEAHAKGIVADDVCLLVAAVEA